MTNRLRAEPAGPQRLRAASAAGTQAIGVDRENAIIRGYVVAELGLIRPKGRGEFDLPALEEIVRLGNAATRGLRSNWTHGNLCEDQLGSHLGRSSRFRMSTATNEEGRRVEAVRADLQIDPTALKTNPKGGPGYGKYVMDLAESDAAALASSLVIEADKLFRLKADGTRQTDAKGDPLPPLWIPKRLHSSDIVAQGAAVTDLLGDDPSDTFDGLRDGFIWQGEMLLGRLLSEGRLGEMSRREIKERLTGWLDRALDSHFGTALPVADGRMLQIRQRQREIECGIY